MKSMKSYIFLLNKVSICRVNSSLRVSTQSTHGRLSVSPRHFGQSFMIAERRERAEAAEEIRL